VETAVASLKDGAFDYVSKPFKVDELLITVQRALQYHNMQVENVGLKARLEAKNRFENIIAETAVMRKVCETIRRVAPTDTTVLILGESGTGKELVARAIHNCSPRKKNPFVPVNCAALPEPLLESEMFGHVKGAFTGAVAEKEGLFQAAEGGTIFLDEISSMPMGIQAKLLRVLQDRQIRKVGGTETLGVNVRVLAATNVRLEKLIAEQAFREDLYYRLSVIPIELPPLRERREDILPLAYHFLAEYAANENRTAPALDREVQLILEAYAWPGNVRELQNAVQHAMAFCAGEKILKDVLPAKICVAVESGAIQIGSASASVEDHRGKSLKSFLRSKEKEYLSKVVGMMDGDKEKAAKTLRISLATLYRKLPDGE